MKKLILLFIIVFVVVSSFSQLRNKQTFEIQVSSISNDQKFSAQACLTHIAAKKM